MGGPTRPGRGSRLTRLRHDAIAGAVLGVESVPDGLATGLLAGINPLAGVYGYMVGTVAGAVATSSAFMAVQGTGAMAIIVADVPTVHDGPDPPRALFTLAMLTGVVMVVAGAVRLGGVLRFVSNAVMVGFINAVGVNIVLGQLANLTGYSSDRGSRLTRALDTVLHPGRLDGRSVAVGLGTIVLILVLERTPLRSLGLVVAVFVTSAGAGALGWGVATVKDLGASARHVAPPGGAGSAARARAPGAGDVAGPGRADPGSGHLGQLPQRGRELPRRVARLPGPGRRQPRVRARCRACRSAALSPRHR